MAAIEKTVAELCSNTKWQPDWKAFDRFLLEPSLGFTYCKVRSKGVAEACLTKDPERALKRISLLMNQLRSVDPAYYVIGLITLRASRKLKQEAFILALRIARGDWDVLKLTDFRALAREA